MLRTQLYAEAHHVFLHDLVLDSCRRNAPKTALVDTSNGRRLTYAEYGEAVESAARGLIAAGLKPGEVVAIFLPNSWEFCIAYHAVALAGAIPTLLNPTYREREVRYQLENSGAALLITDGANSKASTSPDCPICAGSTPRDSTSVGRAFFQPLDPFDRKVLRPGQPSE